MGVGFCFLGNLLRIRYFRRMGVPFDFWHVLLLASVVKKSTNHQAGRFVGCNIFVAPERLDYFYGKWDKDNPARFGIAEKGVSLQICTTHYCLIREESGDSWAEYSYDLAGNRTGKRGQPAHCVILMFREGG